MIYILLIALSIAAIIIGLNIYKTKTRKKQRIEDIAQNWGKPIIKYRNFDQIRRYLTNAPTKVDIPAETATDIDIDGLFSFLDRTYSKSGQQYLYKKLHCFETESANFDLLEKKILALTSNSELRKEIQLKLSELSNDDAYHLSDLFNKKHKPLFSSFSKLYILLAPILVIGLIGLICVLPSGAAFLLLLAVLIINAAVHFLNKKHIFLYTHSLPQLIILCDVGLWLWKRGFANDIEDIDKVMQKVTKLENTLGIVNFQSRVNDPTDFIFLIKEWFRMLLLIEPLRFLYSINKVNKNLTEIKVLYEFVGDVDMCISIQSFRSGLPYYCRPVIHAPGNELVIKELYHPLIENCIPNSISSPNNNVVLITGSNMSGKTTFIRAVAINSILAQTINTCCATAYLAPPLKVLTSIHVNDDMSANTSYFQAEALALLNIINQSSPTEEVKSLVIIDEIFHGTNTIERIAAAMSVLSYLAGNNNFVFVSTHDLELAQLLGDNFAVYCFEETMIDQGFSFDYKMKEGLLKTRNGIAVLKRMNYPSVIIDRAFKVSKQLREKYDL